MNQSVELFCVKAPRNPPAHNTDQRKIRLGIVDDHPVVRLGLRALLDTHDQLEVVALAENGEVALQLLQEQEVDIFLVDLRMQGLSGIETIRRIRNSSKDVRAIILSSFEYDEEIYAAVKAGAQGFVHKEADPREILKAILEVSHGKKAFPRHISERLAGSEMTAGLSPREEEILHLVAIGLTNKEVASALHLSQFTVRNHLNHVARKLDASDRTEAIFIALKTGLISVP